MPQGIGVGPDLELGPAHLGDQPHAPLVGAVAEVAEAVADDLLGLAEAGPGFGRPGDVHQVAKDAMGTLRLGEDGAERTNGAGVGLAHQQQLGAADDDGQGIVQLVARPGGELGQGIELRLAEPRLLAWRPGRDGRG